MWLATTAHAYAAYMLLFLILVLDSDQFQILRSCTLTLAAHSYVRLVVYGHVSNKCYYNIIKLSVVL